MECLPPHTSSSATQKHVTRNIDEGTYHHGSQERVCQILVVLHRLHVGPPLVIDGKGRDLPRTYRLVRRRVPSKPAERGEARPTPSGHVLRQPAWLLAALKPCARCAADTIRCLFCRPTPRLHTLSLPSLSASRRPSPNPQMRQTCETVVMRKTTELSTLGEKLASGSRDETQVPPKQPWHPISEHGPAQGGAGSLAGHQQGAPRNQT